MELDSELTTFFFCNLHWPHFSKHFGSRQISVGLVNLTLQVFSCDDKRILTYIGLYAHCKWYCGHWLIELKYRYTVRASQWINNHRSMFKCEMPRKERHVTSLGWWLLALASPGLSQADPTPFTCVPSAQLPYPQITRKTNQEICY